MSLSALPIHGIPEVRPGDDLTALIVAAATHENGPGLMDGDILVVTSKVVSKTEGRLVSGRDREEVIDEETHEVVSSWTGSHGRTVIARTRHGLVLAAAGVDGSNVEPGTLVLLPEDPDASARTLRGQVLRRTGANVGVVISDTAGRPWRHGQTDVAIGVAGIIPVAHEHGSPDGYGNTLRVTASAVADEIAGAAELVATKTSGIPTVVIRGVENVVLSATEDGPGSAALIRSLAEDRFRWGTADAIRSVVRARRTVREFTEEPVPHDVILRAIAAAVAAPAPHHSTPWRFVVMEGGEHRYRFLDSMRQAWERDLRHDGVDEDGVAQRLRSGGLLWRAPCLVVPCLDARALHSYPDQRRKDAERSMFGLSMGAAVQNLSLTLTAEGWGSAWMSSTLFCQATTREALALDECWEPQGCLAVGRPQTEARTRDPLSLDELWVAR